MSLGKKADSAIDTYYDIIRQIPKVKNTIDKVTEFLFDSEKNCPSCTWETCCCWHHIHKR